MQPDFPIALARDGSYDVCVVSTRARLKHHDIAVVAPDKVVPSDDARMAGVPCGLHVEVSK